MGVIRVLNQKGDTATAWPDTEQERGTTDGTAETLVAKSVFEDMMRKGYLVYEIAERGKPGEQVRTFKPDARELIATPPLAGG